MNEYFISYIAYVANSKIVSNIFLTADVLNRNTIQGFEKYIKEKINKKMAMDAHVNIISIVKLDPENEPNHEENIH